MAMTRKRERSSSRRAVASNVASLPAGQSGVFYIHPWELDPDQPRVAAPFLSRVRHYRGLEKTVPRLERLVTEFRFTSAAQRYGITEEWVPAMPS